MAALMYRIGDYVLCDNGGNSSSEPFQIRRIEELSKVPYGAVGVEARVVCFYRRRDLSASLLNMLDKQMLQMQSDEEDDLANSSDLAASSNEPNNDESTMNFLSDFNELTAEQKYYLKHREVFLSRQVETIPAANIRGKCTVNFFNASAESYASYLSKDFMFFYRYLYDPQQRSLTIDRSEVRIGPRCQADVPDDYIPSPHPPPPPPPLTSASAALLPEDSEMASAREELMWAPTHKRSPLTDIEIDQVMMIARSVGTFARALDCSGANVRSMDWSRASSLHMSAAAASRDSTLQHAMNCIHKSGYDVAKAVLMLVPSSGPVMCRDELEDWSPSESYLFEEGLDKFEKDFNKIRKEVLPWKSIKSIIEYYYMWKTTDRYMVKRRNKMASTIAVPKSAANATSNSAATSSNTLDVVHIPAKLKQVFIPPYSKPSQHQIPVDNRRQSPVLMCASCTTQSAITWYSCPSASLSANVQGSTGLNSTITICDSCWNYWRYYAGLKWCGDWAISHTAAAAASNQRTPQLQQKCSECSREFRGRHTASRHAVTAHGIFKKQIDSPMTTVSSTTAVHPLRSNSVRDNFYLCSTAKTRLSRLACRNTVNLSKMWAGKIPVDLAALNHDWSQQSTDDLKHALQEFKSKREKRPRMSLPNPNTGMTETLRFPAMAAEKMTVFFDQLREASSSSGQVSVRTMKRPKLLRRNEEVQQLPSAHHTVHQHQQQQQHNQTNVQQVHHHNRSKGEHPVLSTGVNIQQQSCNPSFVPPPSHSLTAVGANAVSSSRQQLVCTHSNVKSLEGLCSAYIEAADGVFYFSTNYLRSIRKQLILSDLRKAARNPFRPVLKIISDHEATRQASQPPPATQQGSQHHPGQQQQQQQQYQQQPSHNLQYHSTTGQQPRTSVAPGNIRPQQQYRYQSR